MCQIEINFSNILHYKHGGTTVHYSHSKNITPLILAGRREAKNCEAVDCVLFCLRGHAFHEIVLTNNIKTQLLTPNVLEVVNCVQYLYQSPCTLKS